jgi:hypothetical protein
MWSLRFSYYATELYRMCHVEETDNFGLIFLKVGFLQERYEPKLKIHSVIIWVKILCILVDF